MQSQNTICYYYNDVRNFGDMLNLRLLSFFGKNPSNGNIRNSNIMCIGSLLQTIYSRKTKSLINKLLPHYHNPLIVYGSGFIEDTPVCYHPLRKLYITAVRGFHSLEKLHKFGNTTFAEEVAIGDPGLLARYFIKNRNIPKKFSVGIIPHYVDKQNCNLRKVNIKNSIIIDVQQNEETFLHTLAQCDTILSSSLHGLVAADSLRIPNARIILSNNITGGDYKYDDYYSAFGLVKHTKLDLRKENISEDIVSFIRENYKVTDHKVDEICKSLISAFPLK